jgi:hypothetical protein
MPLIHLEGRGVEKILDLASKAIGFPLIESKLRKEARGEAYRIEKLAEANAKAALITDETNAEIAKRAGVRVMSQEVTRQQNIEHVINTAASQVGNDVSSEPVDSDWRTRFFNKAQDVSTKEMQVIWAKILAEEVTKPDTTSIRTLDVLANISPLEAKIFESACTMLTDGYLILKFDAIILESTLAFDKDFDRLRDCGLLRNGTDSVAPIKAQNRSEWRLAVGNDTYSLSKLGSKNDIHFSSYQGYPLTTAGVELARILNIPISQTYVQSYLLHEVGILYNYSLVTS